jgi:hypothetical protein
MTAWQANSWGWLVCDDGLLAAKRATDKLAIYSTGQDVSPIMRSSSTQGNGRGFESAQTHTSERPLLRPLRLLGFPALADSQRPAELDRDGGSPNCMNHGGAQQSMA